MDLLSLTLKETEELFKEMNLPAFRARQIFQWIGKSVTDFNEMTNLPGELREKLEETAKIQLPEIIQMQVSKTDGTRKFLLEFSDGNRVETVFMKYKYGNTICLSSQAGCRMGCKFCASGINGLARNLTSGEIYSEILAVEQALKDDPDERINHIVIMGTGEPFDNYENVSKFIKIIHEPEGRNLSLRNITVSTCGLVPYIEKFSRDFPQVNLAISLHATNDELRNSMMPINKKYPISELMEASKKYTKETGRRITFEYTMINGVNDSDEDAKALASLIGGMLCHVNVIPLNKVEGSGFDTVSRKRATEFAKLLEELHIPATVRRELGGDIDAACGQLRLGKGVER